MVCENCGTICPDDSKICSGCGRALPAGAPVRSSELVSLSAGALTWGILGAAFGVSLLFGPAALVFSHISRRYVERYRQKKGMLNGRALVGARFAKIGKITGIVGTALLANALAGLLAWRFIPRPFGR